MISSVILGYNTVDTWFVVGVFLLGATVGALLQRIRGVHSRIEMRKMMADLKVGVVPEPGSTPHLDKNLPAKKTA